MRVQVDDCTLFQAAVQSSLSASRMKISASCASRWRGPPTPQMLQGVKFQVRQVQAFREVYCHGGLAGPARAHYADAVHAPPP